MRITGGKYKGRVVECPKGDFEIRPAMDRMRESLFSILGPLSGLSFLDLFTGSGTMALEAASRGASRVVCVERDRGKFPLLLKNVSIAEERIECHCLPVERYVLRAKESFSIVFCDPPFPYAHKRELLESVAARGLVEADGQLLMHFPKEERLPDEFGGFALADEREYGRSIVRFWSRTA